MPPTPLLQRYKSTQNLGHDSKRWIRLTTKTNPNKIPPKNKESNKKSDRM